MFKKIASAVVEHIHETKVASTPSSEATSPVKQTPTTQKASANKVTVCVRVRPRNQKEIDAEMPEFFAPTDDGLNIQEKKEDVARVVTTLKLYLTALHYTLKSVVV